MYIESNSDLIYEISQNNLSNFYIEHMNDKDFWRYMITCIVKAIDWLGDTCGRIGYNVDIGKTELFRQVPFAILPLEESVYSLTTIRNKYPLWDTYTVAEKIKVLDAEKYYETIEAKRYWDTSSNKIITLDLNKKFNSSTFKFEESLVNGEDFFIMNNKVYLLDSFINTLGSQTKKNIFISSATIDLKTIERNHADLLEVTNSFEFPAFQFRETIKNLFQLCMNGPKMRVLQETLSTVVGWNHLAIYDCYNVPEEKAYLWDMFKMTPFDFIIIGNLSVESGRDFRKMVLMTDVLNKVKPAHTAFKILFSDSTPHESLYFEDTVSSNASITLINLNHSRIPFLDTGLYLDDGYHLDTADTFVDGLYFEDSVTVNYTEPEP